MLVLNVPTPAFSTMTVPSTVSCHTICLGPGQQLWYHSSNQHCLWRSKHCHFNGDMSLALKLDYCNAALCCVVDPGIVCFAGCRLFWPLLRICFMCLVIAYDLMYENIIRWNAAHNPIGIKTSSEITYSKASYSSACVMTYLFCTYLLTVSVFCLLFEYLIRYCSEYLSGKILNQHSPNCVVCTAVVSCCIC